MRQAVRKLTEAGVPDPQVDARILLCAAAGIDRADLLREGDRRIGPDAAERYKALIARRKRREPVSRILGRKEFWGLDLIVSPAVLDPRPDTETLVDAVLGHVGSDRGRALKILDLGTGSGAILCALLSELPAALAWGVDRSHAACTIARENLDRCGFAGRSLVLQGDWAAALAPQSFDLVVSNPPYIETGVIARLDADVREHDPILSLDGGADGLAAYQAIVAQLPGLLIPGGATFLEVGAGQADAVSALIAAAGLAPSRTYRDLGGIERVVTGMQSF